VTAASTVRDGLGDRDGFPAAGVFGGDVGGSDEVAVGDQAAVRADETPPGGFGDPPGAARQVEEVVRSSTNTTVMLAASALSASTTLSCPSRQSRTRWL